MEGIRQQAVCGREWRGRRWLRICNFMDGGGGEGGGRRGGARRRGGRAWSRQGVGGNGTHFVHDAEQDTSTLIYQISREMAQPQAELLSIEEARSNKVQIDTLPQDRQGAVFQGMEHIKPKEQGMSKEFQDSKCNS